MADININSSLVPNPKHTKDPDSPITWHAATDCCVNFTPSSGNCFGDVASQQLSAGSPTSLPIETSTDTTYTVTPSCTEKNIETGDTYDITFTSAGGGGGGKKPSSSKRKAKPKAAKKSSAPKKSAQKKPAVKKTAAGKGAAKKSAKTKKPRKPSKKKR